MGFYSLRSQSDLKGEELLSTQAEIPRLVRKLRERTGFTHEKFAAKLDVTFPTIFLGADPGHPVQ